LGGTRGYRNWSEVQARGAGGTFNNDSNFFDYLRQSEFRAWYLVEWAPYSKEEIRRLPEYWSDGTDDDGDGDATENDLYARYYDRDITKEIDPVVDPSHLPIEWDAFEDPHELVAGWGVSGHQTFSRPGDMWRMFGRIKRIAWINPNSLPSAW
jgi:hypothetical protein